MREKTAGPASAQIRLNLHRGAAIADQQYSRHLTPQVSAHAHCNAACIVCYEVAFVITKYFRQKFLGNRWRPKMARTRIRGMQRR